MPSVPKGGGIINTAISTKTNLLYTAFSSYFDGCVQEIRNSFANALELRLSCINPSIWYFSIGSDGTEQAANHGPLARYVSLWVAHASGMPGTFSPPPLVSDPDMHHGTCVAHVSWCMSASLTSNFLWSRWWGKRSRHSRRMRNAQFYVSDKRPMIWTNDEHIYWCIYVQIGNWKEVIEKQWVLT